MTYQFHAYGALFVGHTVPGSARIRLYENLTRRFVAAFDPDPDTLEGAHPNGAWVDVPIETDLELLARLHPQVTSASQARLTALHRQNGSSTPIIEDWPPNPVLRLQDHGH